jgi:hypothetical protein
MKRLIILSLSLLIGFLSLSAQVTKTLVRSVPMHNSDSFVLLSPDLVVESIPWNEPFCRVDMVIHFPDLSENQINNLMASGRYSLKISQVEGQTFASAKGLSLPYTINGNLLREEVKIIVRVPKGKQFLHQLIPTSPGLGLVQNR